MHVYFLGHCDLHHVNFDNLNINSERALEVAVLEIVLTMVNYTENSYTSQISQEEGEANLNSTTWRRLCLFSAPARQLIGPFTKL
jgi:hypothetical protein